MQLKPHQERVVTEQKELAEKLEKLTAFTFTDTFSALPAPEHDRLIRELRDTREHWLTIAKDYRTRANEWASGNVMHTMRLAEAKMLENCAYALAVALQANVRMSDGL